jgi:galacturan 1,4-alpha-galacturonidase
MPFIMASVQFNVAFAFGFALISWDSRIPTIGKMRFQITSVLTIVSATLAVASPAWQAGSDLAGNKVQRRQATETDDGSVRPTATVPPIHPRLPPPVHGKRDKICHVRYNHHRPEVDDSDYVIDAMRRCNDGGHVIFSPGVTYNIAKALDLTFLKHIDIGTNALVDSSKNSSSE